MNKKILLFVTILAMLAILPSVFACYQELTVYVCFCGDTRAWKSKTVTYIDLPTSVEVYIPANVYNEIVKYFGTNTFTAWMHETKYSQSWARWGWKVTGHELAIAVVGVPSITVVLKSL